MYTSVEQLAQSINHDRTHAGVSFGQRVGAQQYERACFCFKERFAYAHTVGADKIDLQRTNFFRSDAHIAEFAYAGGDGISQLVVGHQFIHDSAGLFNQGASVGREQHGPLFINRFAQVAKRKRISVNMKGLHKSNLTTKGAKANEGNTKKSK